MTINVEEIRKEAVTALRQALKRAIDPMTQHAIAATLLDYCREYEPTPLDRLRNNMSVE
jgi:hypothetical protein